MARPSADLYVVAHKNTQYARVRHGPIRGYEDELSNQTWSVLQGFVYSHGTLAINLVSKINLNSQPMITLI